jgi:hypothetical protein
LQLERVAAGTQCACHVVHGPGAHIVHLQLTRGGDLALVRRRTRMQYFP